MITQTTEHQGNAWNIKITGSRICEARIEAHHVATRPLFSGDLRSVVVRTMPQPMPAPQPIPPGTSGAVASEADSMMQGLADLAGHLAVEERATRAKEAAAKCCRADPPAFFTSANMVHALRELAQGDRFTVEPAVPCANTKTITVSFEAEVALHPPIKESAIIQLTAQDVAVRVPAPNSAQTVGDEKALDDFVERVFLEGKTSAEITTDMLGRHCIAWEKHIAEMEREIRVAKFIMQVEHECGVIPSHLFAFARLCIEAEVAGHPFIFPAISHNTIWLTPDEPFVCDCANLLWLRSVVRVFKAITFDCGTGIGCDIHRGHLAYAPNINCARIIWHIGSRYSLIPKCVEQVEVALWSDKRPPGIQSYGVKTINRLARPPGAAGLPFMCEENADRVEVPKFGAPGKPGAFDAIVMQRVPCTQVETINNAIRTNLPFEWDRCVPDTLREQFAASAASLAPMLARFRELLAQSRDMTRDLRFSSFA